VRRNDPDARQLRTARLAEAAAVRAADAEARARRAIIKLGQQNQPVTFASVAAAAGVSKSYLYAHQSLNTAIRSHQPTTRQTPTQPREDQATAASLRTKLHVVTARLHDIEAQLRQARAENEILLGELVQLRRKQNRALP
jgi:urease accessory protein UreF